MKVLVVEDDRNTRDGLVEILQSEGYQVVSAGDGKRALEQFDSEAPDFVCLDIMMPEADGYEVCRKIRQRSSTVPIVFISAKAEEIDKVVGLELGADDFITKPFGVREVVARIRAVTRRTLATREPQEIDAPFGIGDLEVLPAELRCKRGDQVIELSLRDVKILELMSKNPGRVLDRDTIMNTCWGLNYLPSSRSLDQHISQLRKRIEIDPKQPQIIRTVHGVGYRYES